MGFKEQWQKITDNWLFAAIIIVVLAFLVFGNSGGGTSPYMLKGGIASSELAMMDSYAGNARGIGIMPPVYYGDDFAPEAEERKITRSASLNSEVERGKFQDAQNRLKNIVTASGGFILNENVNKYDSASWSYYSGWYSIKVDTKKYDSVVAQLKEIGEVTSFSEGADDVTGTYTNIEIELAAEKERLKRYQSMYDEATLVADKLTLNDRIFDQERRIKYLEQSLESMDTRVDYTTVSVSISEKQSDYMNIAVVKFSQLVRSLVNSFNGLLSLIFVVIPYAVAALIIWLVYRAFKGRKQARK